jgi:DNA-binding transcriptional regulator GbsR (MarR family)
MKNKNKSPELKSLPKELTQLESTVGQFMEYWGFKKIHGRIWTHLYLSNKPLDSIELMARLRVSKGLMSLAIRELLSFDVIITDHVGRHGTTFYIANPDLIRVISNVLNSREKKLLAEAEYAAESLQKLNEDLFKKHDLSEFKLKNIIELTKSAHMLLSTFLIQDAARSFNQTFTPHENIISSGERKQ